MEKDKPLLKVKKMLGGNPGIAQALGLTPQAVSQWKRVPQDRITRISELTGLSAAELRPDLKALARAFAA